MVLSPKGDVIPICHASASGTKEKLALTIPPHSIEQCYKSVKTSLFFAIIIPYKSNRNANIDKFTIEHMNRKYLYTLSFTAILHGKFTDHKKNLPQLSEHMLRSYITLVLFQVPN